MKYLSIVWCWCISYVFIDASTEGYEEEGDYEEEEEEHFDNCTNQGKLYQCKLPYTSFGYVLQDPLTIYLFREPYSSQVFTLQAFNYFFTKVFYSWPLSE